MALLEIALSWMMFAELCIHGTRSEIPCHHGPCRCINKYKVNCSHMFLTEVPSTVVADKDILVLDVSNNQLSSFNASLLPSRLKVAQLSKNRIKALHQGDLYILKELSFLHLDNNGIDFVHPEAFLAYKRLEILTLSGNYFQSSNSLLISQHFLAAPGLRVLDISNCSIRMISDIMFSKLPLLEDLRLSYNHLRSLEEGTFQHLNSLRSLLLRRNLLNKIHKGAFSSLNKLEVLDLAENYLSYLDEPELFSSLINLRYLDLSGNGLKLLHQNVFSKLCSLKLLYLNRNLLNDLSENIFHELRQLTTLDVSNNNIQHMQHHKIFCVNSKLSYLKLTNSFMTCDNCSILSIWELRNTRKIRALFAKCNGKDIEEFFTDYEARQEMLKHTVNCSTVPVCKTAAFEEIPENSTSSSHMYIILGTVFLLLFLSGVLVTLILFRRHFRSKRKNVVSVTPSSSVRDETNYRYAGETEEPQISEELKKKQELFQKAEEERMKLQRELYFQHQKTMKKQQQQRYRETLERNRQEREAKSQSMAEETMSDNTNSIKSPSEAELNERLSYREGDASRLPSVAEDEREWCRADTLPVRDKFKSLHSCAAVEESLSNDSKIETRRYSADDADVERVEDEYWHAKKSINGVKSTIGVINENEDSVEIVFSHNDVPTSTERHNDQVV